MSTSVMNTIKQILRSYAEKLEPWGQIYSFDENGICSCVVAARDGFYWRGGPSLKLDSCANEELANPNCDNCKGEGVSPISMIDL